MLARRRHIAKTITWRIVATGTTFLLTLLFFKEDANATEKAANVAGLEAFFKMVLYYYHERVWFLSKVTIKSSVRHLYKTITWRVLASFTTFIIAFLIFRDDEAAVEKASGIAIVESFLKMILYYLHERVWYRQNLDLESRKNSQ